MIDNCLDSAERNRLDGITKKYVDCQINYLDIQIQDIYNQIGSLNPPNYDDVLDILQIIQQQNEICCKFTTNSLHNIENTLDNHSNILRKLLKCCEYRPGPIRPVRPLIPGQSFDDLTPIPVVPKPVKPYTAQPIIVKPKKIDKERSNLILYPVDKGYFGIIGIPGSWSVQNRRIINQAGEDLEQYLPIYFGEFVCDNKVISKSWIAATGKNDIYYQKCIELVAIRGYVIKDTSQRKDTPLLIYETRNMNGVSRTFEASTSLWNKYSQ